MLQNPAEYFNSLQVKTPADCINSTNKSLAAIRAGLTKETGHLFITTFVDVMICDLVNYFNLGKSMFSEQTDEVVQLIIKEYYMLKPDDFKVCFDNVKKGKYGKVYDRIDGLIIFEWLNAYMDERIDAVQSIKKSEQHKQDSNFIIPSIPSLTEPVPDVAPVPENWRDILFKPKEVKPLEPRKISAEQIMFNGFIRQFDKLHFERGLKKNDRGQDVRGRFIKRYGKIMDVQSYMNYKSNQFLIIKNYINLRKKVCTL